MWWISQALFHEILTSNSQPTADSVRGEGPAAQKPPGLGGIPGKDEAREG